jgi:formate dehydrogenase subunit delta
MSGREQLVQMANDIGNFFRAEPQREVAVAAIANHIKAFWTVRMREKLIAQMQHGDTNPDPDRPAQCQTEDNARRRRRLAPHGGAPQ